MPDNPLEKVESAIKSEPWYVWAGAAGAAGIIVYYVWKRKQASATASTSTSATGTAAADAAALNGYTVDSMAGLPFGADSASGYNYQGGPMANTGSFSEVGVNGNNVPIVPWGETPIFDSNGNLIGYQQPNPTTSPNPTSTQTGVIRPLQTSGQTADFDKNNSGVPFRSSPAGATISELPFGSNVTISGPPVPGPDNFPNDTNHVGSTLWFPVTANGSTGYVSAYDIANVIGSNLAAATGHGSGGDSGGFHLPINAGRNTMDQWTFSNGMHQDFDSHAMVGE